VKAAAALHVFPTYHPSASRTDAEGIARIAMPTADATVLVSATGFVLGKGTTRSGRVALRLERDPGVRPRVRGPTGSPVPGAVVRTVGARDRIRSAGASAAIRTLTAPRALGGADTPLAITDGNGEAIFGRRPAEATALEVEAADGAFARVALPVATPAESRQPVAQAGHPPAAGHSRVAGPVARPTRASGPHRRSYAYNLRPLADTVSTFRIAAYGSSAASQASGT